MQRKVDNLVRKHIAYDACMKTPFANLGLCFHDNHLTSIDFIGKIKSGVTQTAEARSACEQIDRYCLTRFSELRLHDSGHSMGHSGSFFNIKLKTSGTEFQQKVWSALQSIPPGEVITYGELARDLNTSARAVGNACRNNPIPVVIPCHRVVSRVGIGGFSGSTQGRLLDIKKWLLNHEGVQLS